MAKQTKIRVTATDRDSSMPTSAHTIENEKKKLNLLLKQFECHRFVEMYYEINGGQWESNIDGKTHKCNAFEMAIHLSILLFYL